MRNTGHTLIDWAIDKPRQVVTLMVGTTLVAVGLAVAPTLVPGGLGPLPTIEVDVDPENMLEADEPARRRHDANTARFGLHDAVVVGIVQEEGEEGIFNQATLAALERLTNVGKGLPGVVAPDVMSLSTVDSIEHASAGTLRFDYLMPTSPETREQVAAVRAKAERIPFLRDTLFAADGQAAVVYLPLEDKSHAHDVSVALQHTIDQLDPSAGSFHIAGLPVAEETFGIEMFVQMAVCAPAAMLVIFLLMWLFFRRLIVIVSPMIVALVSVLTTMALLVISGQTIHIMSSMIPIFIMPIAVLDAVHIISDFFDRHDPEADRKQTVRSVMRHLYSPMLFTSMTTAAGFASLALTPIPPVRVFGLFVALGVVLAWLWTILFIPAFLVSLADGRLRGFGRTAQDVATQGRPGGFLARLDDFTHAHAKLVASLGLIALVGAGYGIARIQINDNPTRWFQADHPIRVADRELNAHFGGTYDAFLALDRAAPTYTPRAHAEALRAKADSFRSAFAARFDSLARAVSQGPTGDTVEVIDHHETILRAERKAAESPALRAALNAQLDLLAEAFEAGASQAAATQDYRQTLASRIRERARAIDRTLVELPPAIELATASAPPNAAALHTVLARALGSTQEPERRPLGDFLGAVQQSDEVFKDPELLRWMEGLQQHLESSHSVGKASSLVDIVKTVHRDLISGETADYRVPATASVVAQTLDQYQSSHRKDDLWHFVTPDYQHAVLWLQLTSGDNQQMERVVEAATQYLEAHPAPVEIAAPSWFGLTYINVVWQQQMVSGMLKAFLGSFVVVLLMMVVLFRSLLWGLLSMVPLTLTVAIIYGLIGLLGKDYDMPVAVLSSLSLGLAVDYAIHFLARTRDLVVRYGDWDTARGAVFGEPARAIGRNIIVVGVGFLPLVLAPLVPYQTVGVLIASILLLAGLASLVVLPALVTLLQGRLFPQARRVAMKGLKRSASPLLVLLSLTAADRAQAQPTVDEIVRKTNHAAYYQGRDGRAHVKMTLTDRQGRTRVREMTILRRDVDEAGDGAQMFYVYFHAPADVARTVFMVHKKVGGDDDRWLYLPSLDLVKRVAAADKRTSFVGSDFVYEDVSGRGLSEDSHLLKDTTANYYVLEHVPVDPSSVEFARYTMYVHRGTFLPTKVEYYDVGGAKIRVMTVEAVETIQGHPTVTRATLEDLEAGSKTTVEYTNVAYDLQLPQSIFTERHLQRVPVRYMQ